MTQTPAFMSTIEYRNVILILHVAVAIFYFYISYKAVREGKATISRPVGIGMGVIGVGMIIYHGYAYHIRVAAIKARMPAQIPYDNMAKENTVSSAPASGY
jgi:uncharacterized membrane protein YukC